jgi:hypothetical protein
MARRKRGNGKSNGRNNIKGRRLRVLMFTEHKDDTKTFFINHHKLPETVKDLNAGNGLWLSVLDDIGEKEIRIGSSNPDAFEQRSGVIGIYNMSRADHQTRFYQDTKKATQLLLE